MIFIEGKWQSENFIAHALFCNATPFFLLFPFYSIKIYMIG